MPRLIIETRIQAPAELCFDLIRDQRIQPAPSPEISGPFSLGQTVRFESSQFGLRQRLTVRVTEFEHPTLLVDEMIEGCFKTFKHIHEFVKRDSGTLVRDTVVWISPFGVLGAVADKLVLERHIRSLVMKRNAGLKAIAEASS